LHSCAFHLFSVGFLFVAFQHSFFITTFCLRDTMCSAVWSLFKAPYHFDECGLLTIRHAMLYGPIPRHDLFRLDWNEPAQCTGRAVPTVAWLGGRKGAARSLPRPFSYDSNLFATACLSLRTLTGEAFLAEVLLNERISSSSKYRRVSTC
jgi:hypothetical protein